jgi:[CysO sulfur-carrier protein]-S-L-cysteine hydrolase
MVSLTDSDAAAIVAHARRDLPNEACGLLIGRPDDDDIESVRPCGNAQASPMKYTLDSQDVGKANWDAVSRGLELVGVYHSHTHTEAYPSWTDVQQAADPTWHYVVVSLKDEEPVVRSFRIVDGEVFEEDVAIRAGEPGKAD